MVADSTQRMGKESGKESMGASWSKELAKMKGERITVEGERVSDGEQPFDTLHSVHTAAFAARPAGPLRARLLYPLSC